MIARSLRAFLWLASAAAALGYVWLVGRRLGSAQLDPIEGALLDHATRLASHQPLYTEPVAAAPAPLMPGFPVVLFPLVQAFGPQLWEPRALALLATLGVAGLAAAIVWKETQSRTLAAASAGMLLMGCALLTGRPEVARPEALMLLLVLGGYAALRFTTGIRGTLGAAALLCAACYTHQQAVWFTAAAMVHLALEDRKRFAVMTLGLALLGGAGYVLLSQQLGPWFNFAAWDAPLRSLQPHPARLLHYVGNLLLGKLSVLTLAAVLSFALPTPPWRGPGGPWMCMAIATLVTGGLATQSAQGVAPSLIVTVVVLALAGPVSMQRVVRHLAAWPGSSRLGGQGVVLTAIALQYLVLLASVPASAVSPRRTAATHAQRLHRDPSAAQGSSLARALRAPGRPAIAKRLAQAGASAPGST